MKFKIKSILTAGLVATFIIPQSRAGSKIQDDPVFQSSLFDGFRRILSSPLDYQMQTFIESDPLFKQLVSEMESKQEASLDNYIASLSASDLVTSTDKAGMSSQTPYLSKFRGKDESKVATLRIYQLIKLVMKNMGFSASAIENMQIKIVNDNSQNAWTVSGTKNRVVIVLTTALIKSSSAESILAVLIHELGHIVMRHVLFGTVYRQMLGYMAQMATTTTSEEKIDGSVGLVDFIRLPRARGKSTRKRLIAQNPFDAKSCDLLCQHEAMASIGVAQDGPEESDEFDKSIEKVGIYLSRMDDIQRSAVFRNFLKILLDAKQTLSLDGRTKSFLESLDKKFLAIQNGEHHAPMDEEDVVTNLKKILNAISRANEQSADNIASGVLPGRKLLLSMYLFQGVMLPERAKLRNGEKEFSLEHKARLKDELDARIQDLIAEVNKNGLDSLDDFNTGDHPSLKIRVLNILNRNKFPDVVMANPFLHLLVAENNISLNVEQKQLVIANLNGKLNNFSKLPKAMEATSKKDNPQDKKIMQGISRMTEQMKFVIQEESAQVQIYQQSLRQIHETILDKIKSAGLANKINPYWRNLIAYGSLVREFEMRSSDTLTGLQAIENPNNAIKQEVYRISNLKDQLSMDMPQNLLKNIEQLIAKEVEGTADKEKKSEMELKLKQLNVLLSEKTNADELESLRNSLPLLERSTQLKMNLKEIFGSSLGSTKSCSLIFK